MSQRIGVFGGTFDPVHFGHLVLAQDAFERLELDRLLLVPCRTPAHKSGGAFAAPEDRAAMLELAVEGDPRFEVSRVEFERDGPSYTIDTLLELRRRHPGARFSLLVGADTLLELHGWRRIGDLLALCEVASFPRPGTDLAGRSAADLGFADPELAARLWARRVEGHRVDVSSTEVRMRLAEGLSIRYLVPDPVAMYIAEHRLYGS